MWIAVFYDDRIERLDTGYSDAHDATDMVESWCMLHNVEPEYELVWEN